LAISLAHSIALELPDTVVDPQSQAASHTYHFIGSRGGTSDAQHRIALFERPDGDRVEDLIERFVPYVFASG
jgi:hypothetical protein